MKSFIYLLLTMLLITTVVGFYFTTQSKTLLGQLNSCNTERKKQTSSNNINDCYDKEWQKYATDWNSECESISLDSSCDLPASLADKMDAKLQQAYDRCVEVYKL